MPSRVLFVGMNRISIPERKIGEVRETKGKSGITGSQSGRRISMGGQNRFKILGLSAAVRSQLRHHAVDDGVGDAFRQFK